MRKTVTALGIAAGATWSLGASAQTQGQQGQPVQPGWGTPALPPPPSATEQQLDAGDRSGSFRRLELVYLNAEVGGGYMNIGSKFFQGFPNASDLAGQGGAMFGLGAGLRFLYLTLGIRGRIAPVSAYTLIEANLEAGFHVPLGAWDPYLNLHGGYVHASMNSQPITVGLFGSTVDVGSVTPPSPSGGDFGGSLGTDYYFSSLFSLGVDLTLDALFLSTGPAAVATSGNTTIQVNGQSDTGVAFLASLHAGLHFSL